MWWEASNSCDNNTGYFSKQTFHHHVYSQSKQTSGKKIIIETITSWMKIWPKPWTKKKKFQINGEAVLGCTRLPMHRHLPLHCSRQYFQFVWSIQIFDSRLDDIWSTCAFSACTGNWHCSRSHRQPLFATWPQARFSNGLFLVQL